jgi:hypothetical protein
MPLLGIAITDEKLVKVVTRHQYHGILRLLLRIKVLSSFISRNKQLNHNSFLLLK